VTNAYEIIDEKHERKRPVERPKYGWENMFEMSGDKMIALSQGGTE
jgi:hypothetical protein